MIGNNFQVIIIGSGHAGCESALACARTGINTLMLSLNLDNIAFLACNPSIGGTAKGQLVSEIDALGGEMGVNADKTTLQLRMLNMGKGPAVQSLRAQVDKNQYYIQMKKTLENCPNLTIKQDEATDILTHNGKVIGVKTAMGTIYNAEKVIVCTGVYLKSRIIIGEYIKESGPNGFSSATKLTASISKLGHIIRRFKTGTPARVHGDSIDYSKFEVQYGDDNIQTFSTLTKKQNKNIKVCYLGYTNEKTHEIIRNNIHRAPLFSGLIEGVGPRYCPSIEDKITRFADKSRHQFFLEPESDSTKEIYVQGLSSSLPADVQEELYRSIKGFEKVEIMRNAYAIEYDCIDSMQIKATLESKLISGLYFAGQVNGTSGYEEAGAQGLMAGINASLSIRNLPPLILKRNEAYIGVLIDDLVTKGTNEPYRMMTSRAEYRLYLRQDNADIRLTEYGKKVGLITNKRYKLYQNKLKQINTALQICKQRLLAKNLKFLEKYNENIPANGATIEELIKRSNIDAKIIQNETNMFENIDANILDHITTEIKYKGYLQKQQEQIDRMKKAEEVELPQNFDYSTLKGLRLEAIQKLNKFQPETLGQASRISGVSPADVQLLTIYFVKKGVK